MSIGSTVRASFGPYEPQISNLWRSIFIDVPAWTATVCKWAPDARRILEVGCGEGYSTARLVDAFPDRHIDAIDIGDHLGRLYDGPADRASFRKVPVQDVAQESPGHYDLVILSDVIHHVPPADRKSLLQGVRDAMAHDGVLAFKDWHRSRAPIHFAVHASDRWLTGDRVSYLRRDEARDLISSVFGTDSITAEASIRPWKSNFAFRVCRA